MIINRLDIHIGSRLLLARTGCGLSLDQAARLLDLDAAGLERMETGQDRAPASVIYAASTGYSVPVRFFFEGLEPNDA